MSKPKLNSIQTAPQLLRGPERVRTLRRPGKFPVELYGQHTPAPPNHNQQPRLEVFLSCKRQCKIYTLSGNYGGSVAKLTRINVSFKWTEVRLEELKQSLSRAETLSCFDKNTKTQGVADASSVAQGGTMWHKVAQGGTRWH